MKCGQYWPQGEEGEEQFDEYIVINTGMEQNREYSITGLLLHNTQVIIATKKKQSHIPLCTDGFSLTYAEMLI